MNSHIINITTKELLLQKEKDYAVSKKFDQGIAYLRRALELGTDDFSLLSAIYCQLGNAYVLLGEYETALQYHTYDILVERLIGNKEGEAKSCANLGNVFKIKGSYNDALTFTFRQLEIASSLNDEVLETRAHYNLGNIYIERGRERKLVLTESSTDEQKEEAIEDFRNSVKHFEINLELAQKLNDPLSTGRAYGSLGNAHYCLGNYETAISYHKQRLELSQQYGDRPSMRRAHANIANCHALMSNVPSSIQHYRCAYSLASELGHTAEEAQMAYSLANALYISKDITGAVPNYLRHLELARRLEDHVGQFRSHFALALAFFTLRDFRKSVYFLILARREALKLHDKGLLNEVNELLNEVIREGRTVVVTSGGSELIVDYSADPSGSQVEYYQTFLSFFEDDYFVSDGSHAHDECLRSSVTENNSLTKDQNKSERAKEDDFFELVLRLQSERMDDQRADISMLNSTPQGVRQSDTQPDDSSTDGPEALIDLLMNAQGRRMDEQRAALLPGLNENGQCILEKLNNKTVEELDGHLVEWLMRVQSERIDEQRSELPTPKSECEIEEERNRKKEKDVTELVLRMQAGRLEDQRAHLEPKTNDRK
ncbi:unnamed protein product [Caenorhabditis auriculariae]|uniref:Uncharacterized protein n=1 Tax=Caenorhabditis auriculariae TaxID=2777116 RepID=A0A8S1GS22_9PELO|nr:unnamed protein product [Caenorhabditis auriculariae]